MIFRLAESVILASFIKGISITSFLFGTENTPFRFDIELLVLTMIFFIIFMSLDQRRASQEFEE